MSELTDDEIRRKIAELKGIEVVAQTTIMPDGSSIPTGILFMKIRNNCGFLPEWPVSIKDAWELLEEMPTGYAVWRTRKHWICRKIGGKWVEAETAPRAICLAWLGWKEKQ